VLSPYFLPLMQQAVLTTDSRRATAGGHLVGEPLMWEWPFEARPLCVMPGGEEVRPEVITRRGGDPSGFGQVIAIPSADEPGFVAVHEGKDERGLLAVNPDCSEEPALRYLGGVEAADSLGLADYTVLEDTRTLVSGIAAAREGKEVTTVLLLAAVAILLIELFLAQREREETEG
jgi:hypothetical protein